MPFLRHTFETSLSAHQIQSRIASISARKSDFDWRALWNPWGKRSTAEFIGTVSEDRFKLCRNIAYRNSFLPTIYGRVTGGDTHRSCVTMTMSLHPLVMTFVLIWLGAVGRGAIQIIKATGWSAAGLVPLGMFLFGVLLTAIGFFPEAFMAKRRLEHLLS